MHCCCCDIVALHGAVSDAKTDDKNYRLFKQSPDIFRLPERSLTSWSLDKQNKQNNNDNFLAIARPCHYKDIVDNKLSIE